MSAVTRELIEGFKNWPFWLGLGWSDIRRRYVRTVLGPWWSVVNAVVFIGAVSFVYASLFKAQLSEVMPHLAAGYFVWMLITATVNESGNVLYAQGIVIKTSPVRPISFILRMVSRNFMVFAHNFALLFLMAIAYSPNLGLFPVSIIGVLLLALFLTPLAVIISIACCRFRDLEPLIASVMMILFFVTPVLWKPELLDGLAADLVQLNIFYHFIEVVRAPMLGSLPTLANYAVCVGTIVIAIVVAFHLYTKTRSRLAFWF